MFYGATLVLLVSYRVPRYSVSAFAKRVILLMIIKYSSEFVPPRVDSVEESPIYRGVGSELEQILTRSEAVPTCRCSRQRDSEFVPPHVEDTQIHSGAGRNWSSSDAIAGEIPAVGKDVRNSYRLRSRAHGSITLVERPNWTRFWLNRRRNP